LHQSLIFGQRCLAKHMNYYRNFARIAKEIHQKHSLEREKGGFRAAKPP